MKRSQHADSFHVFIHIPQDERITFVITFRNKKASRQRNVRGAESLRIVQWTSRCLDREQWHLFLPSLAFSVFIRVFRNNRTQLDKDGSGPSQLFKCWEAESNITMRITTTGYNTQGLRVVNIQYSYILLFLASTFVKLKPLVSPFTLVTYTTVYQDDKFPVVI